MSQLRRRNENETLYRTDFDQPRRYAELPADEKGFFEGYVEALGPAFRLENTVASFMSHGMPDFTIRNQDFDRFADIEGYEDYLEAFRFADNPDEVAEVKRRIDQEIADRNQIEMLGAGGIAALFTGAAFDPINFLPVGGAAIKARRLAGASKILEGGLMTAKAGFLGASAAEIALQATQETRTAGESAMNVSAAVLLSGIMGTAVAALPVAQRKAFEAAIEEFVEPERGLRVFSVQGGSGFDPKNAIVLPENITAGLAETEFINAFGVDKASAALGLSASIRAWVRTRVPGVRRVVSDLTDVPMRTKAEARGVATEHSVWNKVGGWNWREAGITEFKDKKWTEYRMRLKGQEKQGTNALRRGHIRAGDAVRKLTGAQDEVADLSPAEFSQEVTRAIFNDGKHSIPEVEEVAGYANRILFDEVGRRLEAQKRIDVDEFVHPDGLKTRTSIGGLTQKEGILEVPILGEDTTDLVGMIRGTAGDETWRITEFEVSADTDAVANAYDIDALESVGRRANQQGKRIESTTQVNANEARVWEKLRHRGFEIEQAADAKFDNGVWRARGPVFKVSQVTKPKVPANVGLTGNSYMARRYLQDQVAAKRGEVLQNFSQWFRDSHLRRTGIAMSVDEADILASQAREHILSIPGDRILYEPMAFRGTKSMKERKLLVPDELLLRLGILDLDFDRVMHSYVKTMAPDIELFQRFGSIDLDDVMRGINSEYSQLEAVTPPGERAAMRKQQKSDIADIRTIWNQIRSTDTKINDDLAGWSRLGRAVRRTTFMTLGGGFALSALPDIGKIVMVHGLARTHSDLLVPMMTDFKGLRLASREIKLAGEGLDLLKDSRAHSAFQLGSDYSSTTRYERMLDKGVNVFTRLNLLAPWNAAAKQFAGVVTMARMYRVAQQVVDGKTISKSDLRAMAHFGLDEKWMKRVFDEPWEKRGNLRFPKSEEWTDVAALERLRGSLRKSVNEIIVTPGPGDTPRWLSSEMGKLIGQFKTFAFASVNRTLIPMLQDRDLAALNGAALSMFLGAAVYATKQTINGREVSTEPSTILREGFDRSGMMGFYADAHGIVETLSRGMLGANAIFGGPVLSRFASRNAAGAVFGPSVGLFGDSATLVGAAATGEWLASDTERMRRMILLNNVFYWSRLMDVAVDEINQELGIPKRRSRR